MKQIIILLLAVALLFFGCTGGSNPSTPPTNNGNQNPSTTVNPNTNPTNNPTTNPTTNPTPTTTYAGKSFGELTALGVPLQCDVTLRSDTSSVTTQAKLYVASKTIFRMEIVQKPTPDSTVNCKTALLVMKDKNFYYGCSDGSIFPGTMTKKCDWMDFSNVSTSSSMPTQTDTTDELSKIPPADISCQPWVVDNSKFDISGTICNLNDLFSQ